MIVQLNEIYNPSWIYCDRGSGDYQIERLHIIGEERPYTGLKNKVKGFQFKQTLDIMDPVTKVTTREPMKPFMVNQLAIAFERDKMMLSPFDEVLHKQLIDYEVERISQSGQQVFTSKEEHFVDALGLAYLAFVLEFSELTASIRKPEFVAKIDHTATNFTHSRVSSAFRDVEQPAFKGIPYNIDSSELRGDRPNWYKVPLGAPSFSPNAQTSSRSWSRSSGLRGGGSGRSML